MTLQMVLAQAYLKELDALTLARRAMVAHGSDPVWAYCVFALDARLHEVRALLAREDPQLLREAEARLAAALAETPEPPAWTTDPTVATRVH
jgi:hypothetical protein